MDRLSTLMSGNVSNPLLDALHFDPMSPIDILAYSVKNRLPPIHDLSLEPF